MTKISSGILAASVALAATVAFAPVAFAAAARPAPTTVTTGLTAQEILDKGNAGRAPGNTTQMVPTNLFNQGPFNVNVEQRIAGTTGPSIHINNAELFYVVDGEGTIVSGGELVDAAGVPVVTAGRTGTVNGVSIKGGVSRVAKKGDLIFVPAGQPHQIADVKTTLTMMALHLVNAVPPDPAAAGAPGAGGGRGPGGGGGAGGPGGGGGGRGAGAPAAGGGQ